MLLLHGLNNKNIINGEMIIIKYTGSKNRLSKEIVPIIQSYITLDIKGYIEPFVGGANIIDKIKCNNKIGCDNNEYVIELLTSLRDGWLPDKNITKEMYADIKNNINKYDKHLVGYVATQLSFGSTWFGTYRRDNTGKRDYSLEAYNNVLKQSKHLNGINFKCCSFSEIPKEKIKGYVVYCDPPYKGTYQYKDGVFDYDLYYNWVKEMSNDNIVLCSEYWMPDDFECIWSKEIGVYLNNSKTGKENNNKIEKLYTYKNKIK